MVAGTKGIQLTANGKTYEVTDQEQQIEVTGLKDMTTADFGSKGPNKGVLLTNFEVTVERVFRELEPQQNLFVTMPGKTPYLIPAICTAKNGQIVAISDYRPCGGDIGFGEVDIKARISTDNGKTWGPEFFIADGLGEKQNKEFWKIGFGDAAVVADAERNEILIMMVCGKTVCWNGNYTTDPATSNPNRVAQVRGSFNFGKGRIIVGSDYHEALERTGVPAEELKTRWGVQFIRRTHTEGHHYFISNLQANDVEGWVTLNVPEKHIMCFDPMTGKRGIAKTREVEGKTQVYMQLKSGESIILQTFTRSLQGEPEWKYRKEMDYSLSLDHGWKLRFVESYPAIEGEFKIDTPSSWTEIAHPAAKINRGTALYSLELDLPELLADDWILDLGDCVRAHVCV